MNPEAVLLVTPRWTRNGGVAAHAQASAATLAGNGVRVGVLTAHVDDHEPVDGVSVFHAPALFDRHCPPRSRLGDAARFPAEAVHFHQIEDPLLLDALRERAPTIVSAHGYVACTSRVYHFRPGQECTRGHGPGCVPNLLLRGCAHTRRPHGIPAAYRRATSALSALQRADVAIAYSTAVDAHLATNGVTRRALVPLFTTTATRAGAGHAGRRRVVFAGRIVAPKGVGVLLRAAAAVDAEFVICGDGWRLQAMRDLARRLGVEQRVRFTGWLAAEQIAQELADASVVVVPSLWPEPFGLVGIEAMAAGRPVVASATGGIGDWLQDGVTGLAVAPGDVAALAGALTDLLADPERQLAMGAQGRRVVADRFTPERHVQALMDAYRAARSHWQPAAGAAGPRLGAPTPG